MINLIIVSPHGIDTEMEVYHCDARDMTPIQCLKKMWKSDLKYFSKISGSKEVNTNLSTFTEENEEAYLYFKDDSYYHYKLSFASSIASFFKYS